MRHFVFDAYGTLFDVHSAASRHAAAIGPRAELGALIDAPCEPPDYFTVGPTDLAAISLEHRAVWLRSLAEALNLSFNDDDFEHTNLSRSRSPSPLHSLNFWSTVIIATKTPAALKNVQDQAHREEVKRRGIMNRVKNRNGEQRGEGDAVENCTHCNQL